MAKPLYGRRGWWRRCEGCGSVGRVSGGFVGEGGIRVLYRLERRGKEVRGRQRQRQNATATADPLGMTTGKAKVIAADAVKIGGVYA
jgi:hypothetical protein